MSARLLVTLAALLVIRASADAHPLPNFRYDREVHVRLQAQKVEVRYTLSVSYWTMFTDSRKLFTPDEIQQMQGKLREMSRRYCEKLAPLIAQNLTATLDGTKLEFRALKWEPEQDRDHARFKFVLAAPWRVDGGGPENALEFEDKNFADESGAVILTVDEDRRAIEAKLIIEPEDLRKRDPSEYGPGDAERARKASAVFAAPSLPPIPPGDPALAVVLGGHSVRFGAPPVALAAPEPFPVVLGGLSLRPSPDPTTVAPPAAAAPAPISETVDEPDDGPKAVEPPDDSFFELLVARGPKALFDTNFGLGLLLLAAGLFGAFHAFAPGHGKSVAAAFLVGEQGTYRQAALLGLSTTLAHTGSVILIAGIFFLRYRDAVPADAQHWLGFFGGLLVLFVGLWLFMRRLRGQVDHVHLFGGCMDMCGNHTAAPKTPECRVPVRDAPATNEQVYALTLAPAPKAPMSWVRVVLLGIGAGAIPCVDAVLLLMLAVSAGKLALALPLLLAFSVGLSSVLVLVGSLVVALHRAGRTVSGENGWFRLLPTVSAVLLMGMGMWMARDAWKGLSGGIAG